MADKIVLKVSQEVETTSSRSHWTLFTISREMSNKELNVEIKVSQIVLDVKESSQIEYSSVEKYSK